MNTIRSKYTALLAFLTLAVMAGQASAYEFVSETAGAVSFTPATLTAPLILCIIAAVGAGAVIFVIKRGSKMVKSWIK